jgi:RimJ/RimL family protein N-acetyltransferase
MSTADAEFILKLLNDPSWLRFIGDRGVRTLEDAKAYILRGPVDMYERLGFGFYLVESTESARPYGICGLAQRDYLDTPDLGFAFLPEYCGKGIAYEAAATVLSDAKSTLTLKRVLATTHPDNHDSQKLLAKLGFAFEHVIHRPDGDHDLNLYAHAVD